MDLKNATVIYSRHAYQGNRVDIFDRLWSQDLDIGTLDVTFTDPYSASLYYSPTPRPGDFTVLYFQLPPGLWEYPNARDILKILNIRDVDSSLIYQVGEIIATKWTASLWNAEEVASAFNQLRLYMASENLAIKRIDVKPQNAWDAGTINQDTRMLLCNTFRLTCIQE